MVTFTYPPVWCGDEVSLEILRAEAPHQMPGIDRHPSAVNLSIADRALLRRFKDPGDIQQKEGIVSKPQDTMPMDVELRSPEYSLQHGLGIPIEDGVSKHHTFTELSDSLPFFCLSQALLAFASRFQVLFLETFRRKGAKWGRQASRVNLLNQ